MHAGLQVARIMFRIALAPVWLTWAAYKGVWWAFDEPDERRAAGSATLAPHDVPPPPRLHTDAPRFGDSQQAAFEVVDSTPAPTPPPTGALMGGYVSTLASSAGAGLLARSLASGDSITTAHGWMMWGWITLVVAVASLYVVRHVARRQAKDAPTTWWGRCRTAAGGMKDACVAAGVGVCGVCAKGAHAARRAHGGVRAAAMSRPAQAVRRGVASAWARLTRKPTTPSQAAA
ncbi:MAG: hypothetical protein HBSAPP03_20020 [Phycisphaerae bacterium]|nr:MAG: hypothetical protein HBSAPP03_20020 [Phycisphaerae bacterium]